jgi:hypothetical protein
MEMEKREPAEMLKAVSRKALHLCRAESAGFNLVEPKEQDIEVLQWVALAGAMENLDGRTFSLRFSPADVTLDRDAPQLFFQPERYYAHLQAAAPILELLSVPIQRWNGTFWVATHRQPRKFDTEDARVAESLAVIASAVLTGTPLARVK